MPPRSRKHLNRSKLLLRNALDPFRRFSAFEGASGLLLLLVTAISLTWSNSPWSHMYIDLVELPIAIGVGAWRLEHSLQHWVNDGLMVIFFFLVGLEIKRESLVGALSNPKKAALPILAAMGGMIFPALIYAAFNFDKISAHGWGIPMATDIAFAVGLVTLLGKRVPPALKVFLLALAIVDDMGAILVIAFFYTEQIQLSALLWALCGTGIILFLRHAEVRGQWVYWVAGIFVWTQVLSSGIHATISGVLLGLLTPAQPLYSLKYLSKNLRRVTSQFFTATENAAVASKNLAAMPHDDASLFGAVDEISKFAWESKSPLDRLVQTLQPWVLFGIMPIFAFVNAGVPLTGEQFRLAEFLANPVSFGVIFGLSIGKPLGIVLFSWIAVRLNWGQLPKDANWKLMLGIGCLGGVGFTMALFISHLGLKVPELEAFSKLAILLGSTVSAIIGLVILSLPSTNANGYAGRNIK